MNSRKENDTIGSDTIGKYQTVSKIESTYPESIEGKDNDEKIDEITNKHVCVQIMTDSKWWMKEPMVELFDRSGCIINPVD